MTLPVPTTTGLLGITGPQALWKFQLAVRGAKAITEVTQKQLADNPAYRLPPWMDVSADGSGTTLTAPIDGPHTSGSSYTRAEAREMTLDGKEAAWDSSKGCHRLALWLRLDSIPDGATVSLVQLHDDLDDQIQILAKRTGSTYRLWWSVGLGKGKGGTTADIDTAFPVGVWVPVVLEVIPGRTGFYYGDDWTAPRVSTKTMRQSTKSYSKWGPYCQVSAPKGQNISATFHGVTMTHSATVPAGPPTRPGAIPGPLPTPVPVPPADPPVIPVPPKPVAADVVMIIRHGEKSADKSVHTLNATGVKRALALVGFFTKAPLKAGILTPTAIWASKGTSASMRPLQTVQPLAAALGLPINSKYDFEVTESTVGKALAALHGVTLASAEHTAIPGVVKQFKLAKGSPKPPKAWPSALFSLVWTFTRQPDGTWWFAQIPEGVLPGDATYTVSPIAGFVAAVKQAVGIGTK